MNEILNAMQRFCLQFGIFYRNGTVCSCSGSTCLNEDLISYHRAVLVMRLRVCSKVYGLASDKSFVIIIVHCFHISKRAFKWNSL
jgi:hypothetical protein